MSRTPILTWGAAALLLALAACSGATTKTAGEPAEPGEASADDPGAGPAAGSAEEAAAPPAPAADRVDSPDRAARIAFDALKANDFERLRPILPSRPWIDGVMAHAAEQDPAEAERQRKVMESQGGPDAALAELLGGARERFASTRERAGQELSWEQAEYEGVLKAEIKVRWAIEQANIHFAVRAGDRRFEFKLQECTHIDGVWTNTEGVLFRGALSPGPTEDEEPDPPPRELPTSR